MVDTGTTPLMVCEALPPGRGAALLGDAREELHSASLLTAGLLITSPPYHDVTDQWNWS